MTSDNTFDQQKLITNERNKSTSYKDTNRIGIEYLHFGIIYI